MVAGDGVSDVVLRYDSFVSAPRNAHQRRNCRHI